MTDHALAPRPAGDPRVTIVMTARERHSLTEAAIDSVAADTSMPYRFVYVDIQSPEWLRESLADRTTERFEVIRIDEPLWPQQARARVIDRITTEYVVFMDNDVQVESGWLDKLVACADETGAGVVGPLYLIGDGVRPPLIHMAGGRLVESATPEGRVLDEKHQLANEDPARVAHTLTRQPCDFVEFHCMLVRTELAREFALDPTIRCVHEHIDVSLSARERGLATWFEPAARISYLALAEFMLEDLPFFRERWSSAESEASISRFCEKWHVLDDARSFGGVRRFVVDHVAQIDPIRPSNRSDAPQSDPMRPDELRQTRSGLLDLATARGYARDELVFIASAYHVAHVLVDGGYRPCGRPFINHLAGTASVLVRYGFRADIVAAGLLHSAYTHSPPHRAGKAAAVAAVCATLGGKGSALERRVRAYTLRESGRDEVAAAPAPSTLSIGDAEILAIVAANEIDMHFSGEIRYCGRTDAVPSDVLELIARTGQVLGVEGLHDSLQWALATHAAVPRDFLSNVQYSYRIGEDRKSAVPMASSARDALMQ